MPKTGKSFKTKSRIATKSTVTRSASGYRYRFAKIRSRHPTHSVLRRNPKLKFEFDVVIRFGSSTSYNGAAVELNSVQSIRNCSDKLRMKRLFKEAGINSPVFFSGEEIAKTKPKFPIIKKIQFRSRGHGMVFVKDQKELDKQLKLNKGDSGVYYEEYFDGCREYRFHVSALGCFYTCRKVRKKDAKDRWYFNSANSSWLLETNPGYDRPKTYDSIIKQCQKGLKALGLDFAAFDVRVKKDGSFMILEANSAPSFGDLTAQKYIEHIPKLVKNKKT